MRYVFFFEPPTSPPFFLKNSVFIFYRHIIQVIAPDSGVPSLTGTATVTVLVEDVNDNAPSIPPSLSHSLSEDTAIGK